MTPTALTTKLRGGDELVVAAAAAMKSLMNGLLIVNEALRWRSRRSFAMGKLCGGFGKGLVSGWEGRRIWVVKAVTVKFCFFY